MPDALPLSGMTIVVTRPQQQGGTTGDTLRAAGAVVVDMPALEITPLTCRIDGNTLAQARAVIFVSANAVEHGVPFLRETGGMSRDSVIAAIGQATTRALNDAGFANVVSPQQSMDSEGLLAMPQLQQAGVQGQHVVLVRGRSHSGGRALIEESLTARGAKVVVMECYERREISPLPGQVASLAQQEPSHIAVLAMSVETLDSLMKSFAGHLSWLKTVALLVPHPRVAAAAASRGFSRVFEVPLSPEAMVPALIALQPRLHADMA